MTADEANEYRNIISGILISRGIHWVVEQANEKIALGKLESKEVDASERVIDSASQSQGTAKRKRMAVFYFTAPYSEPEKLTILIEAIELVLVSTAEMEKMFYQNLGSEVPVAFYTDEETSTIRHKMRGKDDETRDDFTEKLKNAISAIKALV